MRSGFWAATLMAVLASESAFAAINKCTDLSGKITYQQQPCAADSTASVIKSAGSDWVLLGNSGKAGGAASGAPVELYLDMGNIRKNGNIRRAYFKSVYPEAGESSFEAPPYYQDFDCISGAISIPVTESTLEAEAKSRDLYWLKKSDLFYEIPWAIGAAKKICAAP